MDRSSNRVPMTQQNPHIGVNKMGKNIKKSPLHQTNFAGAARDQPRPPPQVYNINKNDFQNIVQQLTGSPLREAQRTPTQNPPKPTNVRLQRIRPPPLAPVAPTNRPQITIHSHLSIPAPAQPSAQLPHPNNSARPPPPSQYGQPPQNSMLPRTPSDVWTNTTESPISAYARYLQNSIIDLGPIQSEAQLQLNKTQFDGQSIPQPHLLPRPVIPPPRIDQPHSCLPLPQNNVPSAVLLSPTMNGSPPSLPRINGHLSPLPSPTSQFLLPSPTGFLNLLSPRSPYPLLSPGYQYPPLISPSFSFSPLAHSGILGPGLPLPPSPAYGVPSSPGIFPASSPTWRNQ